MGNVLSNGSTSGIINTPQGAIQCSQTGLNTIACSQYTGPLPATYLNCPNGLNTPFQCEINGLSGIQNYADVSVPGGTVTINPNPNQPVTVVNPTPNPPPAPLAPTTNYGLWIIVIIIIIILIIAAVAYSRRRRVIAEEESAL